MSYLDTILRCVSRYQPSDKPALRAFQREYFGENSRQANDTFEDWLFNCNPHSAAPSLWLCTRDGMVVGQQGTIPVTLKVDDAEYSAAWLVDLMVRPEWRLRGVPPALFAASGKASDIMLGLGVEDEAYATLRRAGWVDITRMSYFVRPLQPRVFGASYKGPRLLWSVAPSAPFRASAAIVALVLGAVTRTRLVRVEAFDSRSDAIWAEARKDYPIIVKRDLAHLRWRFDETPHRLLYQRYYLEHKGRAVGHVVVRAMRWHGHSAAALVDYFAPRRFVAPLLALAFRELSRQRFAAIFIDQIYAGSIRTLKALGCVRVRASWRFMFRLADPQSPLAKRLSEGAEWFVLPADSDYEHIVIAAEEAENPQAR